MILGFSSKFQGKHKTLKPINLETLKSWSLKSHNLDTSRPKYLEILIPANHGMLTLQNLDSSKPLFIETLIPRNLESFQHRNSEKPKHFKNHSFTNIPESSTKAELDVWCLN
jgi:hypothetical protein